MLCPLLSGVGGFSGEQKVTRGGYSAFMADNEQSPSNLWIISIITVPSLFFVKSS